MPIHASQNIADCLASTTLMRHTTAGLPDTRCVYVADREADNVSLMCRAAELDHSAYWLIRSKNNRTLPDGGKLWTSVTAEKPIGEIRFILVAHLGVKSRPVVSEQFIAGPGGFLGQKGDGEPGVKRRCEVIGKGSITRVRNAICPPHGKQLLI